MNVKHLLLAMSAASLLIFGQAYGHAMLEEASPANNAVLATSPKFIKLTFGHPTKLVMLKLLKGKEIIPINVDTSGIDAKTFSIPLPTLTKGQYEATWGTLSADGHPMKGTLSFTVSGN